MHLTSAANTTALHYSPATIGELVGIAMNEICWEWVGLEHGAVLFEVISSEGWALLAGAFEWVPKPSLYSALS